jgi:hypothetical protein
MKLNTKPLNEVELNAVVAAGTYNGTITKVEVVPNLKQTGNNLVLTVRLAGDNLVSTNGKPIQSLSLMTNVSLVDTEKYDHNVRVKELLVATGDPDGVDLDTDELPGKEVAVVVTVQPAGSITKPDGSVQEVSERNNIRRFKVADAAF